MTVIQTLLHSLSVNLILMALTATVQAAQASDPLLTIQTLSNDQTRFPPYKWGAYTIVQRGHPCFGPGSISIIDRHGVSVKQVTYFGLDSVCTEQLT